MFSAEIRPCAVGTGYTITVYDANITVAHAKILFVEYCLSGTYDFSSADWF